MATQIETSLVHAVRSIKGVQANTLLRETPFEDGILPASAIGSHTHTGADITSGTIATARLGSGSASASTFLHGDSSWSALAGGDIPTLDGSKIGTGTIAAARLGASPTATKLLFGDNTWNVLAAADIPSLPASILTSGTIATARLGSGTASASTFLHGDSSWAALAGGDIPSLDASKIGTGTMAVARLGSGTPSSTTALFGDQSYKTVAQGSGANTRIAFWSGANTLSSNAGFAYDTATNLLTVGLLSTGSTTWDLGVYTAGAVAQAGYVTCVVGGTSRRLLVG